MSVTAADSSSGLVAPEGALQLSLQTVVDPPLESAKLLRRPSKALSISSLSDESVKDKSSVAKEACRDVDRELAAIETRLSVFRSRRRNDSGSTSLNAVAPLQRTHNSKNEDTLESPSSPASDNSSPIFSKLSRAQREAGAVADQVATTLMKCDELLQRVKSNDVSRVSSASSSRDRSFRGGKNMATSLGSELFDSMASSPVKNTSAIDEETVLNQKAATVKRFATRCQQDIETSTTKIELHHQKLQHSYLKELQRKYDSKKHVTLMNLREKYEKETKALVRAKMEEYEIEEAAAVKKTRATLLEERDRILEDMQNTHSAAMEESLSHLELQLIAETEREKRELNNQLQEELSVTLKQIQDDNRASMERWELEQRQKLEQELYDHREAAVASVLKNQEARTAELKQEIQASHFEKEETELQKLQKALSFGAQAQLQQLRNRLEIEHEEKLHDIKANASNSLEKETEELKQMLTRSHHEQEAQLKRDLEKKNRVVIMELHDTMQITHRKHLDAMKDAAEQHRSNALATHRQDFELECRQELQLLEQMLDTEMATKLRQLEMEHAEECELKLEQLRARAVNQHARELEAKRSRMVQCKNVLLAEATAFLTFDKNLSTDDRSSSPEDNSAASHLFELKKHLSKELAQYVDVMIAEFDELGEEQHILVAKITESTQLYLSFKRQCGVLQAQSIELTSGLETLHDQLQKKDMTCKKLYAANEALLKRLQSPVSEASQCTTKSVSPSPRLKKSPALAKALQNSRHA
ncbi:hypothetical protein V7S43_008050 [Phytophthora oleae]|uniref:Uncharacterized protein n=1 Tax=Phytophthora oleae TaxID=2107226 RepID=A0ABD3FL84_9STRA